jgi:hypothetical protein
MRKRSKRLAESLTCLEEAVSSGNVVRNVKVLGVRSKNNREYPLEVMERALPMYDGVGVYLDHPSHDRPRSVKDVFGKIVNPRMTRDGIVGDLVYNADHEYAPAFQWFTNNQPESVGLSHEAIAKTKMDYKTGIEIVEQIVELDAVSLVANPATNPRGLFESYTRIMESEMAKLKKQDVSPGMCEGDGKMVPPGLNVEATLVEPGRKVHVPEEEYGSFEEFRSAMKEKVRACMSEEMDPEEKLEKIISTLVPNDLHEMDGHDAEKKDQMEDAHMVAKEAEDHDADDADDKVKAEESIRKSSKVGYKMLLEELDAYRTRDAHQALLGRVNEFCRKAGLADRLVTEAFVDVLASVPETKWAKLVEDRKSIATSKGPISVSTDSLASHTKLTVDGLMKALRS